MRVGVEEVGVAEAVEELVEIFEEVGGVLCERVAEAREDEKGFGGGFAVGGGEGVFEGTIEEGEGTLGVGGEVGGRGIGGEGEVFEERKKVGEGFGEGLGQGAEAVSEAGEGFGEGWGILQKEGEGRRGEGKSGGFELSGGEGLGWPPVRNFGKGLGEFGKGLGGDGEVLVEEGAGEGEVGLVGGEIERLEQVGDQVGGGVGHVDRRRCPRGNRWCSPVGTCARIGGGFVPGDVKRAGGDIFNQRRGKRGGHKLKRVTGILEMPVTP